MAHPLIQSRTAWQGRETLRPVPDDPQRLPDYNGDDLRRAGLPVERIDGRDLVTGAAQYLTDLRLPEMAWGVFVRSPHARARVTHMDLTEALQARDVLAVVTPTDVEALAVPFGRPLLTGSPLYEGEEIALVVAATPEAARSAAALIDLTWEPVGPVMTFDAALAQHETLSGQPVVYRRGNVDDALAAADFVLTDTYTTAPEPLAAVECDGAVACWDHGAVIVHEAACDLQVSRDGIARVTGLPASNVRIMAPQISGNFGGKSPASKPAVCAALMAQRLQRPVRILLDRGETIRTGGYRPPSRQTLTIGLMKSGHITALRLEGITTCGAYDGPEPEDLGGPIRAFYQCPNVETRVQAVLTNRPPAASLRGGGWAPGAWALEQHLDRAASRLGIAPFEIRRINAPARDPESGRPYSSAGMADVLNKAEQLLQGQPDPAEQTQGDRVKHGRGWAVCAWPSGGGLPAAAKVELLRNGDIQVSTGVVESGSGLRTCLAQIVAEEFQMDPLTIRVATGDSAATPPGPAGCGGASIASAGPAVRAAAVHLMEQLRELVGALPEMHGVSFSIADGRLCDDNHPEDTIPLSTVMEKIGRQSLTGEGRRGPNPEDISIRSFGLHRADVAVDMGLGTVRVTSYFALHESGLIINPLTARTHVEGAVIEGISRALFQNPLEDPVTGRRLLTRNPSAGLAGSKDFPQIDFAFTTDIDAAANAIAAKGLNGASVLPVAAAIANAIYNATGIPVTELPMTPDRLLNTWESAQEETS